MRLFRSTPAAGILALAMLLLGTAGGAEVSITLVEGSFLLSGVTPGAKPAAGWQSVFRIYAGTGDIPPVAGTYNEQDAVIRFEPRYPLATGVRYRAVFRAPGATPVEAAFDGPAADAGPKARVEQFYPSSAVWPSNQLKLYVVFSRPMARGSIWPHIRLTRDDGVAVALPFLEIDQELWDPEQKRLTLLFDPGRIKRGVAPQQEMGAVLTEGRSYILKIDTGMLDARGLPLAEPLERSFTVGESLREGIDLGKWRITEPAAGTRQALVVAADRPLDYALLQRGFRVQDAEGRTMDGRGDAGQAEMQWTFIPAAAWRPGAYTIIVDRDLEDVAGNRMGRPFDRDLRDSTPAAPAADGVLHFSVR